jgi:hypothetical protein
VTPQLEKMGIRAAMQAQVSAALQSVRRDSEILAIMLPEVRRAA